MQLRNVHSETFTNVTQGRIEKLCITGKGIGKYKQRERARRTQSF